MGFEIDQSGKIEQTNKPTVVALSNNESKTIRISAVEKQKLIKAILELGRPNKTYSYQILAALIFILLKNKKIVRVSIDTEYSGHTASVKEVLLQLFQKKKIEAPDIRFGLIGKNSPAHALAIKIFRKKQKPDLIVKASNLLELFYKTQGQ